MEAYAKLNKNNIDRALKHGKVVIDGLYSYEEFEFLKKEYNDLTLIAVETSAEKRYERLSKREIRSLTEKQAKQRDETEIEKLNIQKTIDSADFTLHNIFSEHELEEQIEKIIEKVK